MSAISSRNGGVYFLYGHGGTGKKFMWRTLCATLRSEGEIVLLVASSGIASLRLPMGRSAHSRFRIPINVTEDSMCKGLTLGTNLSTLLERTSLIIWDEAPMMSKYCFEALDRSMRDALRGPNGDPSDKPFEGKVIVFGGDFCQILPVVPKGSRQDIVFESLNSSYIWDFYKVLRLTKNMRLQTETNDVEGIRQFADWILQIGDGLVGGLNDGEATIDIPSNILIIEGSHPIRVIVESIYPNIQENLLDGTLFHDRAILAPTNEIVSRVNDYVLSLVSGEEKIYLNSDSISKFDNNAAKNIELYLVEFLNTIKCSGLPNHEIRLKIGSPIMLLCNIDQAAGLCTGTRLVVNQLGLHIIEATVLSGSNKGAKVFIPRVTLTPSESSHLPVRLKRRQFPLNLCFAMTINKSQGQSLKNVGLFLPKPVFSHGQLYVVVSHVTTRQGLKILICDKDNNSNTSTDNVVYKEVFQNFSF